MSTTATAVLVAISIITALLEESVRTLYYRKVSEKKKAKAVMNLMSSLGVNVNEDTNPEESEED